jgi:hypothetical protein
MAGMATSGGRGRLTRSSRSSGVGYRLGFPFGLATRGDACRGRVTQNRLPDHGGPLRVCTLVPWSDLMAPVMGTLEIRWLRGLPKPMGPEWKNDLVAASQLRGPNYQGRLDIRAIRSGPCTGKLYLVLRRSVSDLRDFSVGVVFEDLSGNSYSLIRCNGPSPQFHTNEWPRKSVIVGIAHIHHLTAYYQRRQAELGARNVQGHTLAIPTRLYSDDYRDAIAVLGRKANITSQGSLWGCT